MKLTYVLLILATTVLGACGDDDEATPTATLNSGIDGLVLAGPQCPVEHPQSPCPDAPLAGAPIKIAPVDGASATISADANGHFRVELAPGEYAVIPLPINSLALPAPGESQRVTVTAGNFTEVTLTYDTGIR